MSGFHEGSQLIDLIIHQDDDSNAKRIIIDLTEETDDDDVQTGPSVPQGLTEDDAIIVD